MASYWKVKVSEWNNHISIVLSFFFLLFSIKKKISCVLHEGSFSNICAVGWGKFQNFMQQFLGQIEKKKNITNPFGMEGTKWSSSITKRANGDLFFLLVTNFQRSRNGEKKGGRGWEMARGCHNEMLWQHCMLTLGNRLLTDTWEVAKACYCYYQFISFT